MTKVMVRLYFSTRQKNVLDEAGEETTWEETCSFYAAQRKCWKSILGNIRGAKKGRSAWAMHVEEDCGWRLINGDHASDTW